MKNLIDFINEALSKAEKEKIIGTDFTHVVNIYPDETNAKKITFVLDGKELWIKDTDTPQGGMTWTILTTNKNEAVNGKLRNYVNGTTHLRIDGWNGKGNGQFNPTTKYGLYDDDMVLWISDIKGNKVYLEYTTNKERMEKL